MDHVNAEIFRWPLDVADTGRDFRRRGNVFRVLRFEDSAGTPLLDGLIQVKVGNDLGDAIPLGYNCALKGATDRYVISWAAQPGYIAVILVSWIDGDFGLDVESPPARQLVTSSAGTQLYAGTVAVGGGAPGTLVRAANNTRQSLTIRNNSGVDAYIGPSGLTSATGMPLSPGEAITLNGTTAAVYALVPLGPGDIRYLEEAS